MKRLVVLTSYENFEYTADAIRTCIEFTPDCFVLVIDDASPGWPAAGLPDALLPFGSNEYAKHGGKPSPLYEDKVGFVSFVENGGLLRSWNHGLDMARAMGAEVTTIANNDVLFTPRWYMSLEDNLGRFDLVGPLSNAPGVTAGDSQHVASWLPDYRLSDEPEELARVAKRLGDEYGTRVGSISPVNGFFMTARTEQWFENRYDEEHVFCPNNTHTSKGHKNPTPLMTLGEDEYQGRLRARARLSAVVPGSFIFHYRSVARGDRYKRGMWMRKRV